MPIGVPTMFRRSSNCLAICAFLAAPVSALAAYVTSVVPNGSSTAGPSNFVGRTVNVMDFGAKCDAVGGSGKIDPLTLGKFKWTGHSFQTSDILKHIVISGAGNWTLNGYLNSGSNVIFNVGNTGYSSSGTFYPSLIGAAGGAAISDPSGAHVIPSMTSIQTGYWGTPETGTISTTGTTNGTVTLTIASASLQLVGQNGQAVLNSSGAPVNVSVVAGMSVTSSSGDINTTVQSIMGTTITLSVAATGSNQNETIFLGGYIIFMNGNATGTSTSDTITIPGAPLATTISGVEGDGSADLTVAAAVAVPSWVATKVTAVSQAGSGYNVGDFIGINDNGGTLGSILQVTSVSGGVISATGANVYAQTQITSDPTVGSSNYFAASTSGGGTTGSSGPQFTMQYSKTGQFWYGTDDSSAINLALSGGVNFPLSGTTNGTNVIATTSTTGVVDGMSVTDNGIFIPAGATVVSFVPNTSITISKTATGSGPDTLTITGPQLPQGSDAWLPANRDCGVTTPVYLSLGNNSLRGWDVLSSGIVALAPMPFDSSVGGSYVVQQPNTAHSGGGMRDAFVEVNKLALYGVAINGGEGQFYENVRSQDAIGSEWLCGPAGTQINSTIFDHIRGLTAFDNFGPIALRSANNFLVIRNCEGEEILHSYFDDGWIPILDTQQAYNLYLGDAEEGIEPFNPEYCVELTGGQTVLDDRCENVSLAGIYVNTGNATVGNVAEQFNNSAPWNGLLGAAGATYGVLIATGKPKNFVQGVNPAELPAEDIVYQQGAPHPSTIIVNNPGASLVVPGPGYGIPNPQGRLTLQSGAPVMTGNVSGASTIYYDCYTGQNVPIFNGGTDQLDAIVSCELRARP